MKKLSESTAVEVVKIMARQALEFVAGVVALCGVAAAFVMGVIGVVSLIPGNGMTDGEMWAGRAALGVLILSGGTVWYLITAEKVKCRKARERGSWFD